MSFKVEFNHNIPINETTKPEIPPSEIPKEEPPLFFSDTPSDQFWHYLFCKGIIGKDGLLKPDWIFPPLPPLAEKQINAIKEVLYKPFLIKADQFEGTILLGDVLSKLKYYIENVLHLKLEGIEIVGGAVPTLLGASYYIKAFKQLGLEDIEDVIPPELWLETKRQPPDYDIRINIPDANADQLKIINSKLVSILSNELKQPWMEVKNKGLSNFCSVDKGLDCFCITSISNRSDLSIDILSIKSMKRRHLFMQDALTLPITSLLNGNNKQTTPIIPQSSLACSWQALTDRMTKLIHADQPETINKDGLPMLLSYLIRDRVCPDPHLEKTLLNNVFNLPQEESTLISQVTDLFQKCIKNHHSKNPSAIFLLQLSASKVLSENMKTEDIADLWKQMTPLFKPLPSEKSSESLFDLLVESQVTHSIPSEVLTSMLQLKGFLSLCLSDPIKENKEYRFNLKMHKQVPALQFVLYHDGKSHTLLIPFDLKQAIEVVTNYFQEKPINESLLGLLQLNQPFQKKLEPSPQKSIELFVKNTPYFLNELIQTSESLLSNKEVIFQTIGFELLLASYNLSDNCSTLLTLIQKLPDFMTTSNVIILENVFKKFEAVFNRKMGFTNVKTFPHMALRKIRGLKKQLILTMMRIANSKDKTIARQALLLIRNAKVVSQFDKKEKKLLLIELFNTFLNEKPDLSFELLTELNNEDQIDCQQLEKFILTHQNNPSVFTDALIVQSIGKHVIKMLKKQKNQKTKSDNIQENFKENILLFIAQSLNEKGFTELCHELLKHIHINGLDKTNLRDYLEIWKNLFEILLSKVVVDLPHTYDLWHDLNSTRMGQSLPPVEYATLMIVLAEKLHATQIPETIFQRDQLLTTLSQWDLSEDQKSRLVPMVSDKMMHLLEKGEPQAFLKELEGSQGNLLSSPLQFSFRTKTIEAYMAQEKLPEAMALLKKLTPQAEEDHQKAILRKLVGILFEKLRSQSLSTNTDKNLVKGREIFKDANVMKLFEGYPFELLPELTKFLQAASRVNLKSQRNFILELLEMGFKKQRECTSSFENKRIVEFYSFVESYLPQLWDQKQALPKPLKELILQSLENILMTFKTENNAQACLNLWKGLEIHGISATLSSGLQKCLVWAIYQLSQQSLNNDKEGFSLFQLAKKILPQDETLTTTHFPEAQALLENSANFFLLQRKPEEALNCVRTLHRLMLNSSIKEISTYHLWEARFEELEYFEGAFAVLKMVKESTIQAVDEIKESCLTLISNCSKKSLSHTSKFLKEALIEFQILPEDPKIKSQVNRIIHTYLTTKLRQIDFPILWDLIRDFNLYDVVIWKEILKQIAERGSNQNREKAWLFFREAYEAKQFPKADSTEVAECFLYLFQGVEQISNSSTLFSLIEHPIFAEIILSNPSDLWVDSILNILSVFYLRYLENISNSPKDVEIILKQVPILKKLLMGKTEELEILIITKLINRSHGKFFCRAMEMFKDLFYQRAKGNHSSKTIDLFSELMTVTSKLKAEELKKSLPVINEILTQFKEESLSLSYLKVVDFLTQHPNKEFHVDAITLLIPKLENFTKDQSLIQGLKSSIKLLLNTWVNGNPPESLFKIEEFLNDYVHKLLSPEEFNQEIREIIFRRLEQNKKSTDWTELTLGLSLFLNHIDQFLSSEDLQDRAFNLILESFIGILAYEDSTLFNEWYQKITVMLAKRSSSSENPSEATFTTQQSSHEEIFRLKMIDKFLNLIVTDVELQYFMNNFIFENLKFQIEKNHSHQRKKLETFLERYCKFTQRPQTAEYASKHFEEISQFFLHAMDHLGYFHDCPEKIMEFSFFFNLKFDAENIEAQQLALWNALGYYIGCKNGFSTWKALSILNNFQEKVYRENPVQLTSCYIHIIQSIRESPFFLDKENTPLFTYVLNCFSNHSILSSAKKSPAWEKAAVEICDEAIKCLNFLCVQHQCPQEIINTPYNICKVIMGGYQKVIELGVYANYPEKYSAIIENTILPFSYQQIIKTGLVKLYHEQACQILLALPANETPSEKFLGARARMVNRWISVLIYSEFPHKNECATSLFDQISKEKFYSNSVYRVAMQEEMTSKPLLIKTLIDEGFNQLPKFKKNISEVGVRKGSGGGCNESTI